MKLHYKNTKLTQLVLFVTANLFLVSCGTYQSVYNDDGIYADSTPINKEKKVKVVSQKEFNDYEDNYFSKRLDELQNINDDEIFTDVDSYYYDDQIDDEEIIDGDINYSASQPWGLEDNDVIVNINLNNNPFWGGFGRNWGFNGWAVGGWNNWGWGFNNPWRWRRGIGLNWGYDNWRGGFTTWGYIDPYAGVFFNSNYVHLYSNFGHLGYRNYRYTNGNFRYGRRNTVAANTTTRRSGITSYSRDRSNSRITSTSRRTSSSNNRISKTRPIRRSSTISRNGSTSRRTSTIRGNSSTRRTSSTIRRGSSSSRNRSSNARRSSSSSRNRSSSARTSSSRSRSSSTRSSGSSSRSSGSTSRRSSSRRGN